MCVYPQSNLTHEIPATGLMKLLRIFFLSFHKNGNGLVPLFPSFIIPTSCEKGGDLSLRKLKKLDGVNAGI